MTQPFDLTVVDGTDGEAVVVLAGEIDVYAAPDLREAVLDLLNTGHHRLVLDLADVTFIDSTGLGVLVGVLKRIGLNGDGSLRLRAPSPQVSMALGVTGLDEHFVIEPLRASA